MLWGYEMLHDGARLLPAQSTVPDSPEKQMAMRFRNAIGEQILTAVKLQAPDSRAVFLEGGAPVLHDIRTGTRMILDYFVDHGERRIPSPISLTCSP
jgi:hypothetical protein